MSFCDCNQGRLPCTCKNDPVSVGTAINSRLGQMNLSYMRALLNRAQRDNEKMVTVSTLDLADVLKAADSAVARAHIEIVGQHAGFCRVEDVRGLCSGSMPSITMSLKKTPEFNLSMCFKDLPAKIKGVRDGQETNLLPAPPVCEQAVC